MRSLLSVLVLMTVTTLCHSAEVDGGPISMMLVKIEGDQLVSQSSTTLTKNVVVTGADGTTKSIPVKEQLITTTARELKMIRVTGNDDKEIAAADLARMLKDTTPVFFLQKPMPAETKAKFKSSAIFLEYAEPKAVEKK